MSGEKWEPLSVREARRRVAEWEAGRPAGGDVTERHDPTPEQVGAYLLATGWTVHPASDTDPRGWLIWQRGEHLVRLPRTPLEDYPRLLARVLTAVAYIEGRPSPAEQVAGDILERARWRAAAEAAGVSLSAWVREQLDEASEGHAILDAVREEVAVTLAAARGGQVAGTPPLPLSVAQRWRHLLDSGSTEDDR